MTELNFNVGTAFTFALLVYRLINTKLQIFFILVLQHSLNIFYSLLLMCIL